MGIEHIGGVLYRNGEIVPVTLEKLVVQVIIYVVFAVMIVLFTDKMAKQARYIKELERVPQLSLPKGKQQTQHENSDKANASSPSPELTAGVFVESNHTNEQTRDRNSEEAREKHSLGKKNHDGGDASNHPKPPAFPDVNDDLKNGQ